MSVTERRQQAVQETITRVKSIVGSGVTREALQDAERVLLALAAQEDLFPVSEFPSVTYETAGRSSVRYRLHEDEDRRFALYLNAINPGKNTQPHNHTTWAIIAAVEGDELNRIYERVDDGSDLDKAQLKIKQELVVRPGQGISFMPEDIHSIHVTGDQPTRHLHLYGRALETLTERLGFDLQTGKVVDYNRNYMSPTHQ